MPVLLIISTVLITLALLFYSLGVWSERLIKYLKTWHVVAFWIGFVFDISGTWAMHLMSTQSFDITEPHTLTGQIAILLMLFHASWATWVIYKGKDKLRMNFHKFSFIVWMIWLIPYFGGMYLAMGK